MQLGVIADDFTGATDIASFLVRNGMPTVQLNGVPTRDIPLTSEAVVISLKTRSCPAEMAVSQSLAALRWLQAQGCQQFYFKYCSTFDSTAQGNIGPVLDALLAELGETRTVISRRCRLTAARSIRDICFVGEQLLNESGMRHHPVTPMEDAHLGRLIERQGRGKAALIAWPIVARSPPRWRQSRSGGALCGARRPQRTGSAHPGRGAAGDEAGLRRFRPRHRPRPRLGAAPWRQGGKRSGRHAAGRSGGGALGLLLGDDQQPGGGLSSTGPRPRRRLKRLLYRSGELRQDAD